MKLRNIDNLADCFRVDADSVLLSGLDALVRLLLLQSHRDRNAGLATAGFVSGYRGSPLGGLDQALWRAGDALSAARIRFDPGVNEELAATAVWGSQQANLFNDARYDGVFGFWYGKGPGVDRAVDALKHANFAGTSRYGGVLVAAGDDRACKSSTVMQQSEFAFVAATMPVLSPADVGDIIEFGLLGYALSRFSGCWVGFVITEETADATQTVNFAHEGLRFIEPELALPEDGLHIRWPDTPPVQEHRLHAHKLRAVAAFARANRIDRVVWDSPSPRVGLVTAGKAHNDLMQALDLLGIDAARAADLGVRILKVGMSWPLEPEGIAQFAAGLEEIFVIEEKRAILEPQIKEQLFGWAADRRPAVLGKLDEQGAPLLPSVGELTAGLVAEAVAQRVSRLDDSGAVAERAARLAAENAGRRELLAGAPTRMPHFCSGCPHNTSTVVPEGSRAVAGIGCHFMVTWMGRSTSTFTQMGGEGAAWIGQEPFVDTEHVFQNVGDGTYTHSGSLAIRAAIAAGSTMTFKILYNDAVAMTGGQAVEGSFSPAQIAQQLVAEGVGRVVIVTDDPGKYASHAGVPAGVDVFPRESLDEVQRQLREQRGVSALIYDQSCAAQARRRRNQGVEPMPEKRVVINELVCEGCGDCGEQSNCLSVLPLETELGRKRTIDQSACNRDYSCLKGFCPSFVTIRGGTPHRRRSKTPESLAQPLSEPPKPAHVGAYNVVIAGIGGTGVVTLGRLLGLAAHLDGKAVLELAQTGLAQKFGAVLSHVRIAENAADLDGARIPEGSADIMIGCDLMVAAGPAAISRLGMGRTALVINSHEGLPPGFIEAPDLELPGQTMLATLRTAGDGERFTALDATGCASELLGDAQFANMFMLGFALQKGLLPVSAAALDRALELFGSRLEQNRHALALGRYRVSNPDGIHATERVRTPPISTSQSLADIVGYRRSFLTAYQNASYAERYARRVEQVRKKEQSVAAGSTALAETVARNYFKLLAYKDEYEVARLYTQTGFLERLAKDYEGKLEISLHLAPPFLQRLDKASGRPGKREFGSWMLRVMRVLARLRFLRGTRWDLFGYARDRRIERRLIADYEALLDKFEAELDTRRFEIALGLAQLPQEIRGFGPVKAASIGRAEQRCADLLAAWRLAGDP